MRHIPVVVLIGIFLSSLAILLNAITSYYITPRPYRLFALGAGICALLGSLVITLYRIRSGRG